jgi:hypothetical protein|tara:strand:+ start:536 stop:1393 length:858 start_codon:yes stop_codon:yes gene_type:complete
MEKSLEKILKEACKQKFGISFKEMESFTFNDDSHLIVEYDDEIFLFADLGSYVELVKETIIEGEASWARVHWTVLVDSEIDHFHNNPKFRGILWQSLNKKEQEFYQNTISPVGATKEADYWQALYLDKGVYQKALKALYDTYPSPETLVFDIVTIGYNENYEDLLDGCEMIETIEIAVKSERQPIMQVQGRGLKKDEVYVDLHSAKGTCYADICNNKIDKIVEEDLLMKRFKQLKELVDTLKGDFKKFYNKGNNAAGTRVRKGMQEMKNVAQEIRIEIQNKKNSQ